MGQFPFEEAGDGMMKAAKTVAALHDLSGVGRCALTVAIPVISAMGAQVIPAPTAVLSAHTAFPDFVGLDLTDYLEKCLDKWCEMGLEFDCVYTGYMASVRQEELARGFMDRQKKALRVVDPVLGDDGRMYRALPKEMPEAMRRLCRDADVITPNMTEAALLTGWKLPENDGTGALGTNRSGERYEYAQVREILERLMELRPGIALVTGVRLEDAYANVWMEKDGRVRHCAYEPVPASYPGTGDLFASVLTGAMMQERPFEQAVSIATEYVRETIQLTLDCDTEPVYGVQLEKTLGKLI